MGCLSPRLDASPRSPVRMCMRGFSREGWGGGGACCISCLLPTCAAHTRKRRRRGYEATRQPVGATNGQGFVVAEEAESSLAACSGCPRTSLFPAARKTPGGLPANVCVWTRLAACFPVSPFLNWEATGGSPDCLLDDNIMMKASDETVFVPADSCLRKVLPLSMGVESRQFRGSLKRINSRTAVSPASGWA